MWLEWTMEDGTKFLVNMNNVTEIISSSKDNCNAVLVFDVGNHVYVHVKETLDEIADMIDKRTPFI